jgi:hypothetical protein
MIGNQSPIPDESWSMLARAVLDDRSTTGVSVIIGSAIAAAA